MYIGLHEQYPLFLSYLIKIELSRQIFGTQSKIKFNEYPPREAKLFRPDGQHSEANSHGGKKNICLCQKNEPRLPVRQIIYTYDTHYTKYKALMNLVCRHERASMRISVRLTQKKDSVTYVKLVFHNI
jgi:hypothetical protein